jgi:uncharacterized membrane protein
MLRRLLAAVERIERTLTENHRITMLTLDGVIASLNAATNLMSAEVSKLHADLAAALAAGVAPTQEQLASLQGIADKLTALGADPAAPVPASPTAPVEPPPASLQSRRAAALAGLNQPARESVPSPRCPSRAD